MNANELADKLEKLIEGQPIHDDQLNEAVTMLRQQQEQINELTHRLKGADAIIKMWTPIVARNSMADHLKESE